MVVEEMIVEGSGSGTEKGVNAFQNLWMYFVAEIEHGQYCRGPSNMK